MAKQITNLKKNKNYSSNHTKQHFYLLKGLCRCGRCGANLYGRIKTDERTYMCSSKRYVSCGLRSVNLDRFNNLVWEIVTDNKFQIECLKKELKSQNIEGRKSMLEQENKNAEKEIGLINKKIDNIIILFGKEKISLEQFDKHNSDFIKERAGVEKKLKSDRSELSLLNKHISQISSVSAEEDLKKQINTWSDADKRQFLNRKVKNITVLWDDVLQNHLIAITFEAGFEISKTFFTKANGQTTVADDKELITKGIYNTLIAKKFVTKSRPR